MSKCISYSLFGYNNQHKDCYDFKSYLRYLTMVIRMDKLLYPDFDIVLHIDTTSFNAYSNIFEQLAAKKIIKLVIVGQTDPLCKAMLWRLKPIYTHYDWVLCRDIDSLPCYKERAAVQVWMDNGTKTAHCMTDSVSHTITMMGGMVGFQSGYLRDRMQCDTWDKLVSRGNYDFNVKGSDQDFMNREILPKVADSLTEHYFLGMPNSFRNHCFFGQHIVDHITVNGISEELKDSNHLVNHIGQAGFITEPVLKFFDRFGVFHGEIAEIEKQYPDIYYWWK